MSTMQGIALSFAIVLLPLTGLVAGVLAHLSWVDGRGSIVWPIVFFALSSACLVGCVLTREVFLSIVLILMAVGVFLYLGFFLAISFGT